VVDRVVSSAVRTATQVLCPQVPRRFSALTRELLDFDDDETDRDFPEEEGLGLGPAEIESEADGLVPGTNGELLTISQP
jgi:hypothetical protein